MRALEPPLSSVSLLQVSGVRPPSWPVLKLDYLLGLPYRLRLDITVLLAATLGGPVPVLLLDETLSILSALHQLQDAALVRRPREDRQGRGLDARALA